jgi:Flp pilus assembly protein TadD
MHGPLPRPCRSLLPLAAALAVSLALGGCNSVRDMTTSIGLNESTDLPRNEAALNRFAEDWGQCYDRNPKDKKTAMTYANALRALGQHAQAVAACRASPHATRRTGKSSALTANRSRIPDG